MKKFGWLVLSLAFIACDEDAAPVDAAGVNDESLPTDENTSPIEESIHDDALPTDVDAVGPGYQLVDVEYTEVAKLGNLPFEQKRYEIFRDKTTFEQFFVQLKGEEAEIPEVDFEKNMVVFLFNGKWPDMRPIHHLEGVKKLVFDNPDDIHSTVLQVETTVFYYRQECPVNAAIYYPTHIISVPQAEFVNFVDHFEIETDC